MDTAETEPQAVVVRREPERELVVWTAPSRPFKRKNRQFYITTFSMVGIVSLVLFLAEGIMPVLLIISMVFLYYILSTVEPEKIEYKITTKGVKIAGKLTNWNLFDSFYFTKKMDSTLIVFETVTIPGKMEIVIEESLKERLQKEITAYIPFEEREESQTDKLISFISSKIPGNN